MGDREPEVVEKEELEFELVELGLGKAADLCISRIRIEHIAEELARHRHPRDHQPMHIIAIDHERPSLRLQAQLRHSVKVDEEREEDVIRRWTVFEDPEEVGFEGDGGHVPCVEGKGGGEGGEGCTRGSGECVPYRWVFRAVA